jgi:hypothetical protein
MEQEREVPQSGDQNTSDEVRQTRPAYIHTHIDVQNCGFSLKAYRGIERRAQHSFTSEIETPRLQKIGLSLPHIWQ